MGGILFALSLALYASLASHLGPLWPLLNKTSFGGDTRGSASAMAHLTFEWKHPLFSISTWPLVELVARLFQVSKEASVGATVAILAALNMALAYAVLRRGVGRRSVAAGFTACYALLGANLLIFGIPETYSASNLLILAYLFAFLARRDRLGSREALELGGISGLAALYNPPLISLAMIHSVYALRTRDWRKALGLAGASLGVAAAIFLVVNVTAQAMNLDHRRAAEPHQGLSAFYARSAEYAGRYLSIEHFSDSGMVATVGAVFFLFGVVSRAEMLTAAPAARQVGETLRSPETGWIVLLYAALLLHALARCAKEKSPLETSLLAWIGGLFLFYVYWQPWTATRFSPQILAPLTLVLARDFEHLRLRPKYYALAAFSLCLAVSNLSQLYGTR